MVDQPSRPPSPNRTRNNPWRETLAALDLGSNSFHLVVARVDAEGVHVVDDRREMVRLAEGLDARNRIGHHVERRALECLDRFGATLRRLPRGSVRVVGTNALRKARNATTFIRHAEQLLGHPVEIVSGREEARLTYLGVASTDAPAEGEKRLLVDIGGGSTECILGSGTEVVAAHSLFMGCVSFTERFFPEGRLKKRFFEEARTAALIELRTFADSWRKSFDAAWGSSGTMRSIESILIQNRWSDQGITPEGLSLFADAILRYATASDAAAIQGLAKERAAVIPGGVAIAMALMEAFGIPRMRAARGAMREGILYDLIGRHADHDIRESSIRSFAQRNGVDLAHSERVERTAHSILEDVAREWKLSITEWTPYVRWASMLHEIGQSLSYTGYHKHSAYLVQHASLAGLAAEDALVIAALIGLHRRRPKLDLLDPLPPRMQKHAKKVAAVFRLAAALHRSRAPEQPPVRVHVVGKHIELRLPASWVTEHALVRNELELERPWLKKMGLRLEIMTR